MRKIKDVLRLKLDAQLSHERIAASLGLSKGVVTKYVTLAAAAQLDWPTIQGLDEADLQRRLLPAPAKHSDVALPDYGYVHQELRRKGMTLMLLWEEHVAQRPEQRTHKYSQFCEHYRQYARTLKRSMRQTHRAGEKLFVDFAGPTLGLNNGDRVHIFVASLGASSYTFACATPRESMMDWLNSISLALRFYGGVPQLIVPDNPRAMISDPDRYEPGTNVTVADFARHYSTSVLPARPYHPQDKGKVESAVQVVERWIMMRLRNTRFNSIDDVNDSIRPLLDRLNNKNFQKMPGTRASCFTQIDAPALQPLPAQLWEFAVFKLVRVHIDQHIEFEGHRYSVPQALVSQQLEARVTAHAVEVLHRGQRVACHARNMQKGGYTTVAEHLSAAHRAHMEWTPERLIHWGETIGVATGRFVSKLLHMRRHPEHGYRACLGLFSLAKRYGKTRLEAACLLALEFGVTKYSHVRDILANHRDQVSQQDATQWTSPEHEHVRGPSYYQ